jgi:O-antigen/teichoic acid export membrane protein
MLGTGLALRIAFAALVTAIAWFIGWALGYDARTQRLSVLFIVATLPPFLAQGYSMAFKARDQMGRDVSVTVSYKAVTLVLTLLALGLGAGIPGVLAAQAVGGLAGLRMAAMLYRRLGATRLRASFDTARELLAGGSPILLATAAVAAQPYVDAVILSHLVPAPVVGWFAAARTVLGTLLVPANVLGAAMYPRLARASGDARVLREEVRSGLRPLLWFGGLAAAGTYLFAGTAIAVIYGASRFAPAATVLEVFAPGLFLLFIDMLLASVIYATGRGTAFAIAKVVSLVVGTGLDFLLIPLFQAHLGNGGIGVVVAFALSEFVVFAGAIIALPRGTLEPAMALDVLRAVGAATVTLLIFRLMPSLSPWVGIPLCIIIFAAASLASGLLGPRDLAALRTALWNQRAAGSQGATSDQ